MKGIFWHDGTARWAAKIGYKHTKTGERTSAVFYFTGAGAKGDEPPADVIADVVNKQREWKRIKATWDELGPMLAGLSSQRSDPHPPDFSKPVWYNPERYAWPVEDRESKLDLEQGLAAQEIKAQVSEIKTQISRTENLQTLIAELRSAGLLPKGIAAPTRTPTVAEAVKEFISAQYARTQLKIGYRIDVGTYNTTRNNLLLCLGYKLAGDEPQQAVKLLDMSKPLTALDNNDLQAVANYWFGLPGDVDKRRTVYNYFSGFKSFLNWADLQDEFGFTKPKATAKILHIELEHDRDHVTPVNYDLLAEILKDAPERTKIYALLALLAGFYQRDICELQTNEVQIIDGETYITGYRSKEDSEAKARSKIKTTHWIPKPLAELMGRHRAPENAHGLFFLNRYGQPMYHEKANGGKVNAPAKAWEKATQTKKLNFMQLRKWGWNEIQRFGSDKVCRGETLAKRWAGQSGGGVAIKYRFDDYTPVIAAQRKWWKEIGKKLMPT